MAILLVPLPSRSSQLTPPIIATATATATAIATSPSQIATKEFEARRFAGRIPLSSAPHACTQPTPHVQISFRLVVPIVS